MKAAYEQAFMQKFQNKADKKGDDEQARVQKNLEKLGENDDDWDCDHLNIRALIKTEYTDKYLAAFTGNLFFLIETKERLSYVVDRILRAQPILAIDIVNSDISYEGQIYLMMISFYDEKQQRIKTYVFDMAKIVR